MLLAQNANALLLAGSNAIRHIVPAERLQEVYVSAATSATAFVVALGIGWKSVKGKNLMAGPDVERATRTSQATRKERQEGSVPIWRLRRDSGRLLSPWYQA